MEIREFYGDIFRAVAFLGRVPVPARFFDGHDGTMRHLVRAFPLAGLLLTLPAAALTFLLLSFRADPLLTAFLALALQTLVTGALHEDGLGDSADGLGGGRNREHALDIMKDSRIGAYGVIALILSFGLRAAAIAALARSEPPMATTAALLAGAALSRAAMVWHWHALPSARLSGVAASAGLPERSAVMVSTITGILIFAVLTLATMPAIACLVALFVAIVVTYGFTNRVRRRIAGHTGDTIGATQQLVEIGLLSALALAG